MCVAHEHGGDKSGIRKTRKLADASYVILEFPQNVILK